MIPLAYKVQGWWTFLVGSLVWDVGFGGMGLECCGSGVRYNG